MAERRVWLEAALNGPWLQERQPLIPVRTQDIVREGVACARAGAAIIHVHARDPQTGLQRDDADLYAAIIDGIREQVDVIVYPTLPLVGAAGHGAGATVEGRFAAVEELGRRGLLEWTVVDPGSVNFLHKDDIVSGGNGFTYHNPGDHIRAGLECAARHGAHPSYACYEAGFVRTGARLHAAVPGGLMPIYRFMFSDGFTFGFPPKRYALDTYLRLLHDEARNAPWMVAGLAVDISPLIEVTTQLGGHVRVGLEDAPFGTTQTNVEWVESAARAITNAGATLTSAAEIRHALGPTAHLKS
jgi:3-keto-5-aminohexanoate cleavage enzyme